MLYGEIGGEAMPVKLVVGTSSFFFLSASAHLNVILYHTLLQALFLLPCTLYIAALKSCAKNTLCFELTDTLLLIAAVVIIIKAQRKENLDQYFLSFAAIPVHDSTHFWRRVF